MQCRVGNAAQRVAGGMCHPRICDNKDKDSVNCECLIFYFTLKLQETELDGQI